MSSPNPHTVTICDQVAGAWTRLRQLSAIDRKTVHEFKRGQLRSGSGGKVKSRKQAIAIGLSEARRAGGKVPAKRKSSGGKRKRSS